MADAIGSEAVVRQDESVLRRGCRVIYYKFVVLTRELSCYPPQILSALRLCIILDLRTFT
jgi:hypothetical protein